MKRRLLVLMVWVPTFFSFAAEDAWKEPFLRSVKDPNYFGGEYSRGLFQYNVGMPENYALMDELLAVAQRGGKILDAGCGYAYLARDLFSSLLNLEIEFTRGDNLRFWPGKRKDSAEWGGELSQKDYDENKEYFDSFAHTLSEIRKTPPFYVGVTCEGFHAKGLLKSEEVKQVFLHPQVRILTGQYFHDLSVDTILGEGGKKFNIIFDMFGVLTYTQSLREDLNKMLSMLPVGGKLYMKTDRGWTREWKEWILPHPGLGMLAFDFTRGGTTLVILVKEAEEVVIPVDPATPLTYHRNSRFGFR